MSSGTILSVALAFYMLAIFTAMLAFLRMRRENEELRDKLKLLEEARRWQAHEDRGDPRNSDVLK